MYQFQSHLKSREPRNGSVLDTLRRNRHFNHGITTFHVVSVPPVTVSPSRVRSLSLTDGWTHLRRGRRNVPGSRSIRRSSVDKETFDGKGGESKEKILRLRILYPSSRVRPSLETDPGGTFLSPSPPSPRNVEVAQVTVSRVKD